MKFVLMISVCSFITGECKDPITYGKTFNTWKECALIALDTSIKYLQTVDANKINKFQLSTQYTCKQSKEI